MNSWVLIFLGGNLGDDLLIVGTFSSFASAQAYAITTGAPYQYQACQVWGPATYPPPSTMAPVAPVVGNWLAVAAQITQEGNVVPLPYDGTFTEKSLALQWAARQANPASYSYGSITGTGVVV